MPVVTGHPISAAGGVVVLAAGGVATALGAVGGVVSTLAALIGAYLALRSNARTARKEYQQEIATARKEGADAKGRAAAAGDQPAPRRPGAGAGRWQLLAVRGRPAAGRRTMRQPPSLRRARRTARVLCCLITVLVIGTALVWARPPTAPRCAQGALAAGDALLRRDDQVQAAQVRIQADLDRRLLAAASQPTAASRRASAAAALAAARASSAAVEAGDIVPEGPTAAPPVTTTC